MKRYFLLSALVAILSWMTTETVSAKSKVQKVYIFGFAASFNDSTVYFTDIQEIDSAWIEKKNNFLQARQLYSYQLRDYLVSAKQMPHRTCIVFADKKRKKVEKKYLKMRKLYMPSKKQHQGYDIRQLGNDDFKFKVIDLRNFYDDVNAKD